MNSRFLNEAKELEKRWADSKPLKGMEVDRRSTAVLLECQRLHNETGTWDCCNECKEREKQDATATVIVINDTRTIITPARKSRKLEKFWLKEIRKKLMFHEKMDRS